MKFLEQRWDEFMEEMCRIPKQSLLQSQENFRKKMLLNSWKKVLKKSHEIILTFSQRIHSSWDLPWIAVKILSLICLEILLEIYANVFSVDSCNFSKDSFIKPYIDVFCNFSVKIPPGSSRKSSTDSFRK